jgi:hypothetical protein
MVISEALLPEVREHENISIEGTSAAIAFDADGDIV